MEVDKNYIRTKENVYNEGEGGDFISGIAFFTKFPFFIKMKAYGERIYNK